jgi:hypothetical protein
MIRIEIKFNIVHRSCYAVLIDESEPAKQQVLKSCLGDPDYVFKNVERWFSLVSAPLNNT